MRTEIYLNSSILQDFRIFYRELLLLKDIALQHNLSKNDPKETGETSLDAFQEQTTAHRIRRRLEDILINQHTESSGQKAGYELSYYQEAQYIMVALADEIFINLQWNGNEEWKDNLLESLIYNTQDAGDKFFDNLDRFLEADHSNRKDMASLYLIALGLGFKGKYRGTKNEQELFSYRKKLYRYIATEDSDLLDNRSPLFPQVYENIISDRQNALMPDSRPWWLALGVIFVGFVSLSSLIWLTHMNNFSPLINTLEKWSGFR